jgi:DNA-binding transcriptional MocR family regulator
MRPYAKSDIPNADRAFGSFGSGNITVELVNRLGREIVSGRFSASDSLPNEGALSSELKISRTAVREAIKMLTAKGLVGSRPRRGTEVRPVSDWNLLDSDVLRWLRQSPPDRRIVIELLELRLASSRRRPPSRRGERTPLNLPESRRLTASCGRRQPVTTTPSKPIAVSMNPSSRRRTIASISRSARSCERRFL